jgi:hypothetical protein
MKKISFLKNQGFQLNRIIDWTDSETFFMDSFLKLNVDLFIDRNFSIYAHTIFYEMISIINKLITVILYR